MDAEQNTRAITIRSTGMVAAPSVAEVVDAWLATFSAATLSTYHRRICLFAEWLGVAEGEAGPVFLGAGQGSANATVGAYKKYLLVDMKRSPSTVNGRLVALRSLVAYARKFQLIDWELTEAGIKSRSLRNTSGPGMPALAALYRAVQGDDDKTLRDRAILWLLIGQGLREGEVVSLDLAHLDLDGNRLSILGKARHEREWITLDQNTQAALVAWVARRGSEAGPMFTNFDRAWAWKQRQDKPLGSTDRRITRRAVYHLVGYYSAKTGKRIWPHAIRHSAITEIINATHDVNAARLFARHASLATTTIYADNLDDLGGKAAAGHADRFATLIA
jgi:integrase/recombinase XerC